MKKLFIFIWEILKVVIVSVAIILPIRHFLIQPFFVKGASMEPNFHDSEYLIIDELSYRFKEPVRGQVIVFRYPKNPQEYFIKRVIALPGETVQIKDEGVYIFNKEYPNGWRLPEEYIDEDIKTHSNGNEKILVSSDEYFVLGDNRTSSKDSRSFGAVNKSFVIGKVLFRGWPISKASFFLKGAWPNYQE